MTYCGMLMIFMFLVGASLGGAVVACVIMLLQAHDKHKSK